MYVPLGIKEAVREDGTPLTERVRPQHQASVGMQELEVVRNGARYTLKGLMAFQWAASFMGLAQFAGLGAVAMLAAAVYTAGPQQAADGNTDGGLMALAGWVLASIAFALFAIAAFESLLAVRASHRGRAELGALQRREVEAAERALVRGVVVLAVGMALTLGLTLQEDRFNARPLAAMAGLVAGVATGFASSAYFASFFNRYLRNLTTRGARKRRRRFAAVFVLGWTLPIGLAIAGVAAVLSVNAYGCYFDESTCGGQIWSLSGPAFGPPFYLTGELVYQQYTTFYTALGIVAGGLLASRALGLVALSSYRKQLHTAELVLRARIRASAPPEAPPG
jgi:hypothetical protein